MNLTGKGPLGSKAPKPVKDPDYLRDVAKLPCVICFLHHDRLTRPVEVHHAIHDRYGQRKTSDHDTLPLCDGHHQGKFTSGLAIHKSPQAWREAFGSDHSYIEWTRQRVADLRGG